MTEEKKPARFGKLAKGTLYSLLAGAAIAGTYLAHEGDCPPFYVKKTGTSGGICLGVRVDIEEGAKFYGGVVSFYGVNRGEINGLRVGFVSLSNGGTLNGLEAGIINAANKNEIFAKVNGLQIGVGNGMREGNGLQIGAANEIRDGNGLQIGLWNKAIENGKNRYGIGLNYSSKGKNKDKTNAEESKK